MLYYLVTTLYVFVCLVLVLVILLQQGKGGDIANAFGGGGSQAAFGARAGATLLSRLTTACAVLFMVGALVLAVMGQRGPGSVVSGAAPPPAPAGVPAAVPLTATEASPAAAPTTAPASATPPGVPASAPVAPKP